MIMRDERCAETIQRLLDDLHGLLLSRKAGDRGGVLAENVEEKVPRCRGGGRGLERTVRVYSKFRTKFAALAVSANCF